jgi:hypothetical protein
MEISSVSQSSDAMMEMLRMAILETNKMAEKFVKVELEMKLGNKKQKTIEGIIDTYA